MAGRIVATEAAHGLLERLGALTVEPEDLAVEHELVGRAAPRTTCDHLGQTVGHLVEVAGVDLAPGRRAGAPGCGRRRASTRPTAVPSPAMASATSSAVDASMGCTGWNRVSPTASRPARPRGQRDARRAAQVAAEHGGAAHQRGRHRRRPRPPRRPSPPPGRPGAARPPAADGRRRLRPGWPEPAGHPGSAAAQRSSPGRGWPGGDPGPRRDRRSPGWARDRPPTTRCRPRWPSPPPPGPGGARPPGARPPARPRGAPAIAAGRPGRRASPCGPASRPPDRPPPPVRPDASPESGTRACAASGPGAHVPGRYHRSTSSPPPPEPPS